MSELYIGTKLINAEPMTRAEYNAFRGWELPADENGDDEGYLVEYLDGGKPNTDMYAGYVSWSPKEQFENAYRKTSGLPFGLAVEAMIKAEFERHGIRFLDKQGLYPAAPYHMKKEEVGAFPVITIKQGRA